MNQPGPQPQRSLRVFLYCGLAIRFVAALAAWGAGVDSLARHMAVATGVYVIAWIVMRAGRWNGFILIFGVEWPFFVRGWVETFGWQCGFASLHGLLPLATLLFEHLSLRLRIAMAVAPLVVILQLLIFVPPTDAVIEVGPRTQRVLMAGNTFLFVLLMVGVVIHALRIMARERARAESLAASRTRLIANLSHELKTPLAAMLTHLQGTLSREREPERYRQTLGVLERNTRGLGRLVRRMLDFVSAEDVAAKTSCEVAALRPLLDEVIEEMTPVATERAVTVALAGPAGLRHETDAELFKVIMRNLLANAVRYSPPGGTVHVTLATGPRGVPTVTVRDEGPGIPADVRPRIFEAFYRADPARSREENAFGLGLAIVAEYAALLGYKVDVDTAPGRGTAFIVTLGT